MCMEQITRLDEDTIQIKETVVQEVKISEIEADLAKWQAEVARLDGPCDCKNCEDLATAKDKVKDLQDRLASYASIE